MNKAKINRIRSAIVDQCLTEGINNTDYMYVMVVEALKTINKNSVAGHKAAVTKGQGLAFMR